MSFLSNSIHNSNISKVFDGAFLLNLEKSVYAYVKSNSGTIHDAEDIYQTGLLTFFSKLNKNEIVLSCKPEKYVFKICKNLWMQELARKKKIITMDHILDCQQNDKSALYDMKYKEQLFIILKNNMKRLSSKCQELFEHKMQNLSMNDISILMNLKNTQMVKDKTYRCKKRLKELVSLDKGFQRLIQGDFDSFFPG